MSEEKSIYSFICIFDQYLIFLIHKKNCFI